GVESSEQMREILNRTFGLKIRGDWYHLAESLANLTRDYCYHVRYISTKMDHSDHVKILLNKLINLVNTKIPADIRVNGKIEHVLFRLKKNGKWFGEAYVTVSDSPTYELIRKVEHLFRVAKTPT